MRRKPARTLGAALALVAFGSAGCGATEPREAGGGRSEQPRGAESVLLRVALGGGYVPLVEHFEERLPRFILYGNGRAIALADGDGALPDLVERRLTEDGIQAILTAARDAGLHGPDRNYDVPELTDAHTTTFTVVAGGDTHVTHAYALAENDEAPSGLVEFEASLHDLPRRLPEGSFGPARPYDYEALVVFVLSDLEQMEDFPEAEHGGAPAEAEWPLATSLADFGEPLGNMQDVRCGVVVDMELERLRTAAEQVTDGAVWRHGDAVRLLAFVPVLPRELRCPAG